MKLNEQMCFLLHFHCLNMPAFLMKVSKKYVDCTALHENPIYVFLFWELRGLSPNSHIHVSVSDLYIPRIVEHISYS